MRELEILTFFFSCAIMANVRWQVENGKKKERNKTDNPREGCGWDAATTQGF